MAEMVRLGFTAADVGITLASTTVRFSSPRNRQSASSALVYGSLPIRTVPTAVAEGGHLVAVAGRARRRCGGSAWRRRRSAAPAALSREVCRWLMRSRGTP